MSSNKKYWKSAEELDENSPLVQTLRQNEFVEDIPTEDLFLGDKESLESSSATRRDFLKYVGFSTAAASLAACEGPVVKSIPYVVAPERITVGMPDYYATTIADGYDFASVLVKTREGRPIKIENNKMAGSLGGANARVHASVLSLYDTKRLQGPRINGEDASWGQLDEELGSKLNALGGKSIVLLTQTFASPSTAKLIQSFQGAYPNVKHVVYDTISEEAAVEAFQSKYGTRAMADYDFTEAGVIVSVGADFLGDWQGGGYDTGYSLSRIPKEGEMSRHIQFEAVMSLSGANADKRVPMTPSQQKKAVAAIHGMIAGGSSSSGLSGEMGRAVQNAAKQLRSAGSKGVFLTGLPDVNAQRLALEINSALGSVCMDTAKPKMTRQGNAEEVLQLVEAMNAGNVGALLVAGVDPVYSLPEADAFAEAMEKVDVKVSFSLKEDATAKLCDYLAPSNHYLESWGDVEIKRGTVCLTQPTIRPLFDTRQFEDTLLKWSGADESYYDYLRANWSGDKSWNKTLQDGVGSVIISETEEITGTQESVTANAGISAASAAAALAAQDETTNGNFELVLYGKTSMGDGRQANNPWLQEMPDPITRASWDNYLTMNRHDADALAIENIHVANGALNGHYATVKMGDVQITAPVIIQPGQAKGTVGLALGYGKTASIQDEMQVGVNAFPLYKNLNNIQSVAIAKAGSEWHEFACVQLQNTLMGRGDIVKETTLEIFNTKDVHYWNAIPEVTKNHIETPVTSPEVDIWESFDRSIAHHFNLSIDLNACTGCGACVIACHSENNVPVVGKDEVRKSRDMHWLRIDRYYSSDMTEEKAEEEGYSGVGLFGNGVTDMFSEMEEPAADNPQVVFQPVMCQHCNHAPCETVCPVAASAHGRQGQNHMTYNRCVGTRYCANNCPYKVRRFNWFLYNENDEFDYHMNNDLGRMVLNPDVTVRSRGVMEKCSMCIQMTQKTILEAKREGRVIEDGEFATACSNACSNHAIKFGDINDKESEILALKEDDRSYHLLEHVGTKPNVVYQTKVRNTSEA
ncbi:MAG: TAT-variant-translocated molybdopterin oxidoreductase [Leeuwenhoekiella sp.]